MLIPCPNCGERDESEFDYGGRALAYPVLDASPGQWHEALHLRTNPLGDIDEYWYHSSGCECWIRLRRNLSTHKFSRLTSDESNT
ncbi:MAG: sarcosine oxidase subunit delta [Gammaproteobacteria bacterium]|nr:sarcosine oxidase subunit delta [Gammaproteobacteria bacterium]MCP4877427.1 sarcosine oxidase subunit delta [Gammaproteobacteria bacterium]MCP5091271.1 sarcosine oxidase subunit delta [Gammaproteobacteria bacterium]